MPPARIALVADLVEEDWPSMDLVAEMLATELEDPSGNERIELIRPKMHRRFSKVNQGAGLKADRLLNRFLDYPRFLRRHRADYDLFHIVDHSYSQLVHGLPANRTVVTCHDLDTFRCLWEPDHAGRGWAFVAMTRRILSGLQKAAHICCDSKATQDELAGRALVPQEKTSVVPLGVHPALTKAIDQQAVKKVDALLKHIGAAEEKSVIDLLHVGSTIQRKRIDVLLEVVAGLQTQDRRVRLLRVGGNLRPEQRAKAAALGIADRIITLPFLTPEQLAAVYHRAAFVLLASDAEGFGLPVIESMACGTPVIASDLSVLREVGGTAAEYAPVADVNAWIRKAGELLAEHRERPDLWELRRERGRVQARNFTWAETARQMKRIYHQVLQAADSSSITRRQS